MQRLYFLMYMLTSAPVDFASKLKIEIIHRASNKAISVYLNFLQEFFFVIFIKEKQFIVLP
jgi:hypothetical protein